jgi:hybrid cluster-associated redox disulfide protein
MKGHGLPTGELTVHEVMRRWPATIRDFLDFRMRCVGCPIAAFHTVSEACKEHDIDSEMFLRRLLERARAGA